MVTALFILLALVATAAGSFYILLSWRDRELVRLARELDGRTVAANTRLTLQVRSAGLVALARAVNAELDREDERARAAAHAQQVFQGDLASLSHDIRTPLAGAQGYLQLAERTGDADERDRYLAQAVERLGAMRALVDGLFEYAKASDPALELDVAPLPLMPALTEVLVSFYPEFSARGWEPQIACDEQGEDVCVQADADALARVLGNLTTNALRYGTGAPSFSVMDAGARVRLCVSNPVEHAARIDANRLFERFYKSAAARSGEGSGLGLAIVARLVAAMGGAVSAHVEGERLSIEVELPRA